MNPVHPNYQHRDAFLLAMDQFVWVRGISGTLVAYHE
jgi:hypothetical protein